MTIKEIIDGLKFTVDMFLFDTNTGETFTEPRNDMDKTTIDACRGAIKILEQENCEDAISRAYVEPIVEEIENICANGDDYILNLLADIKNALPVTPQQKTEHWIPVSERLPETFEFVNCTCHSLIDDREDWVVETVYIPQLSDSPYSDWGNIPMLNEGNCEVVAWIHRDIPKPYKTESEEKE